MGGCFLGQGKYPGVWCHHYMNDLCFAFGLFGLLSLRMNIALISMMVALHCITICDISSEFDNSISHREATPVIDLKGKEAQNIKL